MNWMSFGWGYVAAIGTGILIFFVAFVHDLIKGGGM